MLSSNARLKILLPKATNRLIRKWVEISSSRFKPLSTTLAPSIMPNNTSSLPKSFTTEGSLLGLKQGELSPSCHCQPSLLPPSSFYSHNSNALYTYKVCFEAWPSSLTQHPADHLLLKVAPTFVPGLVRDSFFSRSSLRSD